MRLGIQLLIGYLLISLIACYLVFSIFLKEVKPTVRRATEGMLNDTAALLASIVSYELESLGHLNNSSFAKAFDNVSNTNIGANIDGIIKNKMAYRVYITDKNGTVIFDSSQQDVGKDYSRWNDVYLTLRGKYGARTTHANPADPTSSVMYVAAPIYINQELSGVLTVSKPNKAMAVVIKRAENRILIGGAIWVVVALVIGLFFIWWINRSIKKLTNYAQKVSEHEVAILPKLHSPELQSLAIALENMRLKLEGKDYIEKYILSLTHELKSPLASIRAAVEILQDDRSGNPQTQVRFLDNIDGQSERMLQLVDKMLLLARLESRVGVNFQFFNVDEVIEELVEDNQAKALSSGVNLVLVYNQECKIKGDRFLLAQAINNLIINALDFTPENGTVEITSTSNENDYSIEIKDTGTGIPDYAFTKLYDRFYSLPRPNKSKSSGLGLPFVKEIAVLHNGQIHIENRKDVSGVVARLTIKIMNDT